MFPLAPPDPLVPLVPLDPRWPPEVLVPPDALLPPPPSGRIRPPLVDAPWLGSPGPPSSSPTPLLQPPQPARVVATTTLAIQGPTRAFFNAVLQIMIRQEEEVTLPMPTWDGIRPLPGGLRWDTWKTARLAGLGRMRVIPFTRGCGWFWATC